MIPDLGRVRPVTPSHPSLGKINAPQNQGKKAVPTLEQMDLGAMPSVAAGIHMCARRLLSPVQLLQLQQLQQLARYLQHLLQQLPLLQLQHFVASVQTVGQRRA